MFYHANEAVGGRRLIPYRDVHLRRDLVRSAVLRVVDDRADVEDEIRELRRRVHYYDLCKPDRSVFRQEWHYVRFIVAGWPEVSHDDKAGFRTGAIAPSALVARIKRARRAASAS